MSTTAVFTFRVDDTLLDAIEASAKAAGLKKSMYCREVLASVVFGGVTLEQLRSLVDARSGPLPSPHPARYLSLQGQTGRSEKAQAACTHPFPGIKHLPFTDVCGACGVVVKDRMGGW